MWRPAARRTPSHNTVSIVNVNVNVNKLLAISIKDFDNSGELGPQAKGVNHLETPLRQLHVTHRASSCAKRGGHVRLCSNPWGARGIEPETFRRGGQLLSCPLTTGPKRVSCQQLFSTCHSPVTQLMPLLARKFVRSCMYCAKPCSAQCVAIGKVTNILLSAFGA